MRRVSDTMPRGRSSLRILLRSCCRAPRFAIHGSARRPEPPWHHVGGGVSTLQKFTATKTALGCIALRVAAGAGFRFEALFGCVAAVLGAVGVGTVGHSRQDAVTELVATFDGVFVHG